MLFGQSSGKVPPVDLQTPQPARVAVRDASEPRRLHRDGRRAGRGAPRALFDLYAAGDLDVAIHERYPLEDAARAHEDLTAGTTSGKLLLVP